MGPTVVQMSDEDRAAARAAVHWWATRKVLPEWREGRITPPPRIIDQRSEFSSSACSWVRGAGFAYLGFLASQRHVLTDESLMSSAP